MRALLAFWGAVLLALGTGAGALQAMGPLPRRPTPAPVAAAVPFSGWDGRIAPPDPALLEPARTGLPGALPRIARDGRTPRLVYARPAPARDGRPRVALLLAGFGSAEAESRAAIALPGPVSLAVSAYSRDPAPLMEAARAAGHEMLASLPMESKGFPADDAGQQALLTGAAPAANQATLERVLARIAGYVGVTGASDGLLGERFAAQGAGMEQVLADMRLRGLLYVDPRPSGPGVEPLPAGAASRAVDVVIDVGDPPARAEMEARLAALERLAREHGSAVGLVVRLRPVTIERVGEWARGAEARGLALVPVSALATEETPR